MTISSIIILVVAIVLAVVIIKFITKILAKVLAIVVVLALAGYFLFYWNGGIVNIGSNDFILYEMQEKYCYEKADTATCDCVVTILLQDIQSQYTAEEIIALKDDRMKSVEVVFKSLQENKNEINQCLKEHGSGFTIEEFLNDLKSLKLGQKVKGLVESLSTDLEAAWD